MWIEQNEGAKFWLRVMNELKNRGVEDILLAVVDGLKGGGRRRSLPSFPRRSCRPASSICSGTPWISCPTRTARRSRLPSRIYRAVDARAAEAALVAFEAGPWGRKYPAIGQSWRRVWQEVIPFFSFPGEVRRIIYTTNAIEVLNFKLRRAIRARGHFPSDEAAAKLLYQILNRSEKGMGDATSRMGYGKGSVRRHLRRSLRKGPGGLMFNRPPIQRIPDTAGFIDED